MTTSKRLADRKTSKFHMNITKRGAVPDTNTKKDYPVGPFLLGFFVFVVIGSSLFQIIRTANKRRHGLKIVYLVPFFIVLSLKSKV